MCNMWYATIECNWHTSKIQHGLRCVELYEKCQLRRISPLQLLLQLQGAEPTAKGLRTAAKTGQARNAGKQAFARRFRRSPEGAREGARPPKHRTTAQGKATPAALRPKLRTAARGRKSVSLSQEV